MSFEPIEKVLSHHDNIPVRLRGSKLSIVIDTVAKQLKFCFDVPDDATQAEMEFLKQFTATWVDELRKDYPFIGTQQKTTLSTEDAP